MASTASNADQSLFGVSHLLNSKASSIRFMTGTRIFTQGDPGEFAYMIDSGYVEISTDERGKRLSLAILGPGEIFGEMAIIDGQSRSATATAMHETTVIPIPGDQLRGELDRSSPLTRLMLITAVNRIRASQSKGSRGEEFAVYDNERSSEEKEQIAVAQAHASRQLKMRFDMQKAIANKKFELAYQPIVSLTDGRTSGFEALLRWPQPDGRLESPDQFVPLAEQSRLIVPLGAWVLETALQALEVICRNAQNRHESSSGIFMSVNVSPVQLEHEHDVEQLARIIERAAVDPSCVKIEITEQALLLDPRMATLSLARLKATGASIAIDDFGTGYSSLNYLHRFPLNTLKIDRSFVSRIVEDESRQVVVSAIIGLAHKLGMDVVAEGVEEIDEARWLRSQACRYAQGYMIAKPAPFATAVGHLNRDIDF